MGNDAQSLITTVLAIAAFVLVASVWATGLLLWLRRRKKRELKVEDRLELDQLAGGQERTIKLWHQGEEITSTVVVESSSRSLGTKLNQECRLAGWDIAAGALITWVLGAATIFAILISVVTGNVLLGLAGAFGVVVVFRLFMKSRIDKREARFETQLVDAMELAARSLRAGHPLFGAFQLISEEMAPPVSTMFGDLCQRNEMGESLHTSLQEISESSTSTDMKMFATSIAIQMKTGGNLADLMQRLASVIRERMRLNRRLRILTAQTQMSKRVLIALPFFTFFALNLINPDYMNTLYTTMPGRILLAIGVTGLAIGAWLINKMAKLSY